MNKNIMIGVTGVLVLGIGFLVLTNQNNKTPSPVSSLEAEVIPTAAAETTPTPNTSNWTLFTNKTYNYSIKFPKNYQTTPEDGEQNTCIRTSADKTCEVLILASPNNDNLSLEAYLTKYTKLLSITGPLVPFTFNGYESIFNRNQPGTNVFIKRSLVVFQVVAPKANSSQEIGDIVSTFTFTK